MIGMRNSKELHVASGPATYVMTWITWHEVTVTSFTLGWWYSEEAEDTMQASMNLCPKQIKL